MDIQEITKPAVVVNEAANFADALHAMHTGHSNTLLVTNDEGVLVGEVSVSDLFDAIVPVDYSGDQALNRIQDESAFAASVVAAKDTPVFEFMNTDYDTITPEGTLLEVAAIAIGQGRTRIPVVDHESRPIGIISRQGLKRILDRYLA